MYRVKTQLHHPSGNRLLTLKRTLDRARVLYKDGATEVMLFVAAVIKVCAHNCFLRAEALNEDIYLDNELLNGSGPPKTGQHYLVGPVVKTDRGARAEAVYPVIKMTCGTITEVHGTFGRILADDGKDYFLHENQLKKGATLTLGARVCFFPSTNDRGPFAKDAEPA
jgi:cold shock CspA family protein